MATITLYLDSRTKRPSVKLCIAHNCHRKMVSLGVFLDNHNQWNADTPDTPVHDHPQAKSLNRLLATRLAAARAIQYSREMLEADPDFKQLCDAVIEAIDPQKAEQARLHAEREQQKRTGVLSVYMKVMATYSGRTWEIYETTLRRIREYAEELHGNTLQESFESISRGGLPSDPAQEYLMKLKFEDITKEWLDGWRECMADTKGLNTQSIYLRTFRHICKYAFDNDLTTAYIWKRYPIPKVDGDVHPLTEQEFRTLFCSDIDRWAQPYRRMAWFGFCTIGMNFVDIHKMEHTQLREGYLRYVRSKTGRKYCIKIEPEAQAVIDELGDDGAKVFSWANKYKYHSDYRQHLNHALKQMGVSDMHYYRLRHTWAQFAVRAGVSMDDIARCLGHGKKTVTDVYVEVDQERIDKANRKVIDYAVKILQL